MFIQRRVANDGGVTRVLIPVLIAAFVAAIWFTVGRDHGDLAFWQKPSQEGGMSNDSTEDTAKEREAVLKFRQLSHLPVENRPTFEMVQSLAEALPTPLLVSLLDEFDGSMNETIDGWRRAAIWAEIGKREPARGKALLESRFPLQERPQETSNPFGENAEDHTDDPFAEKAEHPKDRAAKKEANLAAFAYLRGRIEACDLSSQAMEPLIADFHSLAEGISNDAWSSRVDELLFRTLARRNPELAWEILPGAKKESPLTQYRAFFTYPAFDGFFDGLDSRKEATDYAYRWLDYWHSPEVKAAYATSSGRMDEQWEYRCHGISFSVVDALDRLAPDAIDAWVMKAGPHYDERDLKRQLPRKEREPDESLLEFPELNRVFIPKGWSKP